MITFKADAALARALNALENRSEFIRNALRWSLDRRCPLCAGSGVLSADQQRHMSAFLQHHELLECERCHTMHLADKGNTDTAAAKPARPARRGGRRAAAALGLALLLTAGLLFAAAHDHDHQHAGDRLESGTLCLTCCFAGAALLTSPPLTAGDAALFVARGRQPGALTLPAGDRIRRRARAPPTVAHG